VAEKQGMQVQGCGLCENIWLELVDFRAGAAHSTNLGRGFEISGRTKLGTMIHRVIGHRHIAFCLPVGIPYCTVYSHP